MAQLEISIPGINDLAASIVALANAIQIQALGEEATSHQTTMPAEARPGSEKPTKPTQNKVEPAINLATLRAKFVEIAQKGKQEELKALLTEFGSDNVSGLAEDTWDKVYARLEAM